MKNAPCSSLLIEQADALPGLGPALLVTVVATDAGRTQRVTERHVLLPESGTAVNETCYASGLPRTGREEAEKARAGTRVLAVQEAARRGVLLSATAVALRVRPLDPERSNPFVPLRDVPAIEPSLWDIQEWTASPELRQLLGQAVSSAVPIGA